MNCDRARRRLLASDRPDQPSAEVRPHLDACAACQSWSERLTAIERRLPLLPVPPSGARVRLLQLVRAGRTIEEATLVNGWTAGQLPPSVRAKERGLRKLSVAFALAATVAAFAVGLWAWPMRETTRHRPSPGVQMVQQLRHERARHLAGRLTRRDQVEALLDFEELLRNQAVSLANHSDVERLSALVGYYQQMVGVDLIEQAGAVPDGEREPILIAAVEHLQKTESEVAKLLARLSPPAADGQAVAPSAVVEPLQAIAAAALDGNRRLTQLRRG